MSNDCLPIASHWSGFWGDSSEQHRPISAFMQFTFLARKTGKQMHKSTQITSEGALEKKLERDTSSAWQHGEGSIFM